MAGTQAAARSGSTPPPGPDLRPLHDSLNGASDTQLRRVVALVEEMTRRGAADALIAPLRHRLARLRPSRRPRLGRLLFLPLDPLIVAPPMWRPGDPTIPRPALGPLTHTVRLALGPIAKDIDALIAGGSSDDPAMIEEAGALLWPRAADILVTAEQPAGWAELGLNARSYREIATGTAAVLARHALLESVVRNCRSNPGSAAETLIEPIIATLAEEDAAGQVFVIGVLLARLPYPGALLTVLERSARGSPSLRQASDRATLAVLDRLDTRHGVEARINETPLADAQREIPRIAALVSELEGRAGDPKTRSRLRALHQRLDMACRARFADCVTVEFLAPLRAMSDTIDPTAQRLLESTARQLRGLEAAMRPIGGAAIYDTLMGQAASAVAAIGGGDPSSVVRAARLVEILEGPDAAMSVLEQGGDR